MGRSTVASLRCGPVRHDAVALGPIDRGETRREKG
jgi:hypothetical protein